MIGIAGNLVYNSNWHGAHSVLAETEQAAPSVHSSRLVSEVSAQVRNEAHTVLAETQQNVQCTQLEACE